MIASYHSRIRIMYFYEGFSWPWSYGSWIYSDVYNLCLSPLMLWVRIPLRARRTTLCDKVSQWLAAGRWFSPGTLVSSTNKTDLHDITEILLSTIKPSNKPIIFLWWWISLGFFILFLFLLLLLLVFVVVVDLFLYCGFHYVYITFNL